MVHNEPAVPFALDEVEFLVCLRTARRGAAAGPSGMTADHIFPLLESEHDSRLFCQAASAGTWGNSRGDSVRVQVGPTHCFEEA